MQHREPSDAALLAQLSRPAGFGGLAVQNKKPTASSISREMTAGESAGGRSERGERGRQLFRRPPPPLPHCAGPEAPGLGRPPRGAALGAFILRLLKRCILWVSLGAPLGVPPARETR